MNHPPVPYEVDSLETSIARELYDCLANLKRQQLSPSQCTPHGSNITHCAICAILNDPLPLLESDEVRQKAVCSRRVYL